MWPTRGEPRRGEVWWLTFDAAIGGEIPKTRPSVVVSNDAADRALNRIQVVPLTSRTDRLFPAEAYVMSKAGAEKPWRTRSPPFPSSDCAAASGASIR